MDCLFCKIYKENKEVVFKNNNFYARFDKFPVSPGHAEVIPIRHVSSVRELSDGEWSDLKLSIENLVKLIERTDFEELYRKMEPFNENSKLFIENMLIRDLKKRPDGYNYGINEGRAAGQTIEHLHLHIIPRYEDDVEDPIGGIRNVLPLGNYKHNLSKL